jgi:hypothetical protein
MVPYLQSANSLVSRIAQWVGSIPQAVGVNASAFDATTGVITTATNPTSVVMAGDFIGPNTMGPYTLVLSVTSTTITVSDPDGVWQDLTFPTAILALPRADTMQILASVQMCELKMRVLEIPALRSDPYHPTVPSVLVTDAQGMAPIPLDMNWPILFFQETPSSAVAPGSPAASYGPWIIYDRVGDREIIRRRMIDQLYVRPFGVPRVIRASFSEVGQRYVFTPNPGENCEIKAYYQKTFPFLLGLTGDALDPVVQTNAVLNSFPEGYFYGTLWAYYDKNKNLEESQKWFGRFEDAYGLIEDQNYKDKWRGGDQHLTSEWQPRDYRYNFK